MANKKEIAAATRGLDLDDDEGDDVLENQKIDKLRLSTYGRKHEPEHYIWLMNKYFFEKKPEKAVKVLMYDMLEKDRVLPDKHHFNALLRRLAKEGYAQDCNLLMQKMLELRIPLNVACYSMLFTACANNPEPASAEIQALIRKHWSKVQTLPHHQANCFVYNSLINALGKAQLIPEMLRALDEMLARDLELKKGNPRRRHLLAPDAYTLSTVLVGLSADKKQGLLLALNTWHTFKKLRARRYMPMSSYDYSALLKVAKSCGLGTPEQRQKLLLASSEEPNAPRLMSGSQVESQLPAVTSNEATSLLQQLPASNLGDAIEDSRLSRLCLLGGVSGVVNAMAADGVPLNMVVAGHLADLANNAPDDFHEKELLRAMSEAGLRPDMRFYNQLLKARSSRMQPLNDLLREMNDKGFSPDIVTFGIAAMTCRTAKDGIQLLKDVRSAGMVPNVEIYVSLVGSANVNFVYHSALLREMWKDEVFLTPALRAAIDRRVNKFRDITLELEEAKNRHESVAELSVVQKFVLRENQQVAYANFRRELEKFESRRGPHMVKKYSAADRVLIHEVSEKKEDTEVAGKTANPRRASSDDTTITNYDKQRARTSFR